MVVGEAAKPGPLALESSTLIFGSTLASFRLSLFLSYSLFNTLECCYWPLIYTRGSNAHFCLRQFLRRVAHYTSIYIYMYIYICGLIWQPRTQALHTLRNSRGFNYRAVSHSSSASAAQKSRRAQSLADGLVVIKARATQ